jgi:hypothetical protein
MPESDLQTTQATSGLPPTPELLPGSTATIVIEVIRESVRNLIGIFTVVGGYYLLYKFVTMANDKEKIMLLVIGYMGGYLTGTLTWYFGSAMRSALTALQQQAGKQ